MHLEITIALNYLLQNLYNKLPRRRVNLFGEELLHQLKQKYNNHWYPSNPVKGSAYRCLKMTPTDPIISIAANEVNINLNDIIENLPTDLWIWIDPGEVSYRIGNGGQVKILWRGNGDNIWESVLHAEHVLDDDVLGDSGFYPLQQTIVSSQQLPQQPQAPAIPLIAPTPQQQPQVPTTKPPPTMMTTAAFAQTKFGSTKLKTNNKRINSSGARQNMSPTEFSNYIKHKQQLQQLALATAAPQHPQRPRSLSPNDYWSSTGLNGSSFNINHHFDYSYTPLFDPSSVWGSANVMGHHGNAGTPDLLVS